MLDMRLVDQILGKSPYACALIKEDFTLIYMNSIMEQYLSLKTDEEIINEPITRFIFDDDRESFIHFIEPSDGLDSHYQWKTFRLLKSVCNNEKVILNQAGHLIGFGDEEVILLTGLPILTTQLQELLTEEIIQSGSDRLTDKKYEYFFNDANIGIAIVNEKGIVEEANATLIEEFGLSKEEIINSHYEQLLIQTAKNNISNLFDMIRKDKRIYLKDVITIEEGENNHKILEISLAKFDDKKQNQGKYMIISEDITDQRDTHAALIQSEKLALTGRLAASLAHEINNPLQTSIGCLGLVEEMLEDKDHEIGVYIRMAMEELQRSARIVKKLRDLNRKAEPSDKMLVDIQEIIEGVLLLTKNRLYDRNIVPIFPYLGPPPVTMASRDQIQQVILNLVMNAIDALPQGGNIYLYLIPTDDPEGLNIKIRDTGIGITPDVMQHLFDPFFTTKEDGLGLGLYNCKQIINDHKGTLNVESEPGKGTVFTIWLPGLQLSDDKE